MKLGLLSFEYPPETGFGGIGSYTYYHARALARLGHEVHVIAGLNEKSPLCTTERGGLTVHRHRPGGRIMELLSLPGRFKCWWSQQRLQNAWAMHRALAILQRRLRFDLLEMPECGAEGLLINGVANFPTVVRFHSPARLIMPFYDVPKLDHDLCSWLEQRAIDRATALTSCSAFLAREAARRLGVDAPIKVIPNGIDLDLFDNDPSTDACSRFGLPREKIKVFFAGRMERRKGIHLCAAIALALLREHDVAFVFAGQDLFNYMSDVMLPALHAERLRGSIHYLGKLDLHDVRCCLRVADIFLLPSLWENLPYSCLEAMAAGRAIVASAQGGIPEMIEHGTNGLLATPGDAASFIEQLQRLIRDAELRRNLGEAARRTVEERFTNDRVARVSAEFYAETVARWRQT
jgi:glycosyltransferase involved in cell wall biosynthesis